MFYCLPIELPLCMSIYADIYTPNSHQHCLFYRFQTVGEAGVKSDTKKT